MYGMISLMTSREGYCWASNAQLAEMMCCAKDTVSNYVSILEKAGHIRTVVEPNRKTGGSIRRIYLVFPNPDFAEGYSDKYPTTYSDKNPRVVGQTSESLYKDLNKIKIKKIGELFGNFNVVMFSPEDLRIIKDSPGVRRKFIDMELCQLNPKYYYNLVQYNKVLNERNILLRNRNTSSEMLEIYDMQLVEFGYNIIRDRIKYIESLNKYAEKIHSDITSGKEKINFKYISTIKDLENIKENFYTLLEKNRSKDCDRGITSIGPHRDDFFVYINDIDTKSYGSQGQQRTAVLTMKFSSLEIIKELTGEFPVLLLDDVLSELDFNRKKYILSTIGQIQTVITCTGIEDLYEYLDEKAKVFKVKNGEIVNS